MSLGQDIAWSLLSPDEEATTSVLDWVQEVDVSDELSHIEERFGIAANSFDDCVVFRPNSKWLALVNRDLQLPQRPAVMGLGMPFLYPDMRFPRFTTAAAIRFGHLASRHIIDLEDVDTVRRFVDLQVIPLDPQDHPLVSGPGHLLVRHRGMILGLGNCRRDTPQWTLLAMLPKTWREML